MSCRVVAKQHEGRARRPVLPRRCVANATASFDPLARDHRFDTLNPTTPLSPTSPPSSPPSCVGAPILPGPPPATAGDAADVADVPHRYRRREGWVAVAVHRAPANGPRPRGVLPLRRRRGSRAAALSWRSRKPCTVVPPVAVAFPATTLLSTATFEQLNVVRENAGNAGAGDGHACTTRGQEGAPRVGDGGTAAGKPPSSLDGRDGING